MRNGILKNITFDPIFFEEILSIRIVNTGPVPGSEFDKGILVNNALICQNPSIVKVTGKSSDLGAGSYGYTNAEDGLPSFSKRRRRNRGRYTPYQ